MKLNKTVQKKFRIDHNTDVAFRKILLAKNISMQSVMESMLKDYIYNNLDTVITEDKLKSIDKIRRWFIFIIALWFIWEVISIMKNQKVTYKITQTFKTNKENPTYEELKEIFNKKLFKVIMRLEKNEFNINDK